MSTETVPTPNALDAENLPIADYRALREARATAVVEKPPEAPATAETASDAGTEDDNAGGKEADQHEESKESQPKKPNKIKTRFSELTSKIRDLEGQLAASKGGAAAPPSPPSPAAAPTQAAPGAQAADDAEPNIDNYDDYNLYQRDLIRFELRQENKRQETERSQRTQQQTEQSLRDAKAQRWNEQVQAAQAEFADFDAVARNPKLDVTPVMGEAIIDSEVGARILRRLGGNPAEATRISGLSPISQVREIGRLEAAILAEQSKGQAADDDGEDDSTTEEELPPPARLKPVSKAPAPPRALVGRAAAAAPTARSYEGMDQATYRALRETGKLK